MLQLPVGGRHLSGDKAPDDRRCMFFLARLPLDNACLERNFQPSWKCVCDDQCLRSSYRKMREVDWKGGPGLALLENYRSCIRMERFGRDSRKYCTPMFFRVAAEWHNVASGKHRIGKLPC